MVHRSGSACFSPQRSPNVTANDDLSLIKEPETEPDCLPLLDAGQLPNDTAHPLTPVNYTANYPDSALPDKRDEPASSVVACNPEKSLRCRLPLNKLRRILHKIRPMQKFDRGTSVVKEKPTSKEPSIDKTVMTTPFAGKGCDKLDTSTSLVNSIDDAKAKVVVVNRILCLYCERSFVTASLQNRHVQRVHRENPGRRSSGRTAHNMHNQVGDFNGCGFCSEATTPRSTNLLDLFTHMVDKHTDKYFACRKCVIRFHTSENLNMHLSEVHGQAVDLKFILRSNDISEAMDKDFLKLIETDRALSQSLDSAVDFEQSIAVNIVSIGLDGPLEQKFNPKAVSSEISNASHNKLPQKSQKVMLNSITQDQSEPMLSRLGVTQNRSPGTKKSSKTRKSDIKSSLNDKKIKSKTDVQEFSINKNINSKNELFDSRFDKNFYENVNMNVYENLTHFLDGKISNIPGMKNAEPIVPPAQSLVNTNSTRIHESNSSLSSISTFPTLLSSEQYGAVGTANNPKLPRKKATKNSWKWKFHFVKKYKYYNENGKIVKKVKPTYLGTRDLSKLDMWTQLTMKNKYDMEKSKNIQNNAQEQIESDEKNEKLRLLGELNSILDTRLFPKLSLEKECPSPVVKDEIENPKENSANDLKFTRRKSSRINDICANLAKATKMSIGAVPENALDLINFENNVSATTIDSLFTRPSSLSVTEESFSHYLNLKPKISEQSKTSDASEIYLSGEWERPRCYICVGCGLKLNSLKELEDHKSSEHPHIFSTYYEIVGREMINSEVYKVFHLPGAQNTGKLLVDVKSNVNISKGSVEDNTKCTKCSKPLKVSEVYRHMLECSGDYALLMSKKKSRYRPFGSRSRRRKGLHGCHVARHRPNTVIKSIRRKTKNNGPRIKPSDAETIQRMLANLPAKRLSRHIISLPRPRPRLKKQVQIQKVNIQTSKIIPENRQQIHNRASRSRSKAFLQSGNLKSNWTKLQRIKNSKQIKDSKTIGATPKTSEAIASKSQDRQKSISPSSTSATKTNPIVEIIKTVSKKGKKEDNSAEPTAKDKIVKSKNHTRNKFVLKNDSKKLPASDKKDDAVAKNSSTLTRNKTASEGKTSKINEEQSKKENILSKQLKSCVASPSIVIPKIDNKSKQKPSKKIINKIGNDISKTPKATDKKEERPPNTTEIEPEIINKGDITPIKPATSSRPKPKVKIVLGGNKQNIKKRKKVINQSDKEPDKKVQNNQESSSKCKNSENNCSNLKQTTNIKEISLLPEVISNVSTNDKEEQDSDSKSDDFPLAHIKMRYNDKTKVNKNLQNKNSKKKSKLKQRKAKNKTNKPTEARSNNKLVDNMKDKSINTSDILTKNVIDETDVPQIETMPILEKMPPTPADKIIDTCPILSPKVNDSHDRESPEKGAKAVLNLATLLDTNLTDDTNSTNLDKIQDLDDTVEKTGECLSNDKDSLENTVDSKIDTIEDSENNSSEDKLVNENTPILDLINGKEVNIEISDNKLVHDGSTSHVDLINHKEDKIEVPENKSSSDKIISNDNNSLIPMKSNAEVALLNSNVATIQLSPIKLTQSPTKRKVKKLNDCIAMLTGKLQSKISENDSSYNVLSHLQLNINSESASDKTVLHSPHEKSTSFIDNNMLESSQSAPVDLSKTQMQSVDVIVRSETKTISNDITDELLINTQKEHESILALDKITSENNALCESKLSNEMLIYDIHNEESTVSANLICNVEKVEDILAIANVSNAPLVPYHDKSESGDLISNLQTENIQVKPISTICDDTKIVEIVDSIQSLEEISSIELNSSSTENNEQMETSKFDSSKSEGSILSLRQEENEQAKINTDVEYLKSVADDSFVKIDQVLKDDYDSFKKKRNRIKTVKIKIKSTLFLDSFSKIKKTSGRRKNKNKNNDAINVTANISLQDCILKEHSVECNKEERQETLVHNDVCNETEIETNILSNVIPNSSANNIDDILLDEIILNDIEKDSILLVSSKILKNKNVSESQKLSIRSSDSECNTSASPEISEKLELIETLNCLGNDVEELVNDTILEAESISPLATCKKRSRTHKNKRQKLVIRDRKNIQEKSITSPRKSAPRRCKFSANITNIENELDDVFSNMPKDEKIISDSMPPDVSPEKGKKPCKKIAPFNDCSLIVNEQLTGKTRIETKEEKMVISSDDIVDKTEISINTDISAEFTKVLDMEKELENEVLVEKDDIILPQRLANSPIIVDDIAILESSAEFQKDVPNSDVSLTEKLDENLVSDMKIIEPIIDAISINNADSDSEEDVCLAVIAKSLQNKLDFNEDAHIVVEKNDVNINQNSHFITEKINIGVDEGSKLVAENADVNEGLPNETLIDQTVEMLKEDNEKLINLQAENDVLEDEIITSDVIKSRKKRRYKKSILLNSRKNKSVRSEKNSDTLPNNEIIICEICNKRFRKLDGLNKHKMTLTHIAKLSEIEFLNNKNKLLSDVLESVESSNMAKHEEVEMLSENVIDDENHTIDTEDKSEQILKGTKPIDDISETEMMGNKYSETQPDEDISETENSLEKSDTPSIINTSINQDDIHEESKLHAEENIVQENTMMDINNRKALSVEEALFFECCSLLKSSEATKNEAISEQKSFGVNPYSILSSVPESLGMKINHYSNKFSDISSDSNNVPQAQHMDLPKLQEDSCGSNLTAFLASVDQFINTPIIGQNDENDYSPISSDAHFSPISDSGSSPKFDSIESSFKLQEPLKVIVNNFSPISDQSDLDNVYSKGTSNELLDNVYENNHEDIINIIDKQFQPSKLEDYKEKFYSVENMIVHSNSDSFSEVGDSLSSPVSSSDREEETQNYTEYAKSNKYIENINFKNGDNVGDDFTRNDASCCPESPVDICRTDLIYNGMSIQKTDSEIINIADSPRSPDLPSSPLSNKKIPTKGALKVFESLKVSIPTSEFNLQKVIDSCANSKLAAFVEIALHRENSNEKFSKEQIVFNEEETLKNISLDEIKPCENHAVTDEDFAKNGIDLNKSNEAKNKNPESIRPKSVINEITQRKNFSKKSESAILPKSKKKNLVLKFGNNLGFRVKKKRVNTKKKKPNTKNKIKISSKHAIKDIYDFEDSQDNIDWNTDKLKSYVSNKINSKYGHLHILPEAIDNNLQNCDRLENALNIPVSDDDDDFDYLSDHLSDISSAESSEIVKPRIDSEGNPKRLIVGKIFRKNLKDKPEKPNLDELFDNLLSENIVTTLVQNEDEANETQKQMKEKIINNEHKIPEDNLETVKITKEVISINTKSRKNRSKSIIEQELGMSFEQIEEIIGFTQRKSQRKCATGKQNILAENWSSDDDFETRMKKEKSRSEKRLSKDNIEQKTITKLQVKKDISPHNANTTLTKKVLTTNDAFSTNQLANDDKKNSNKVEGKHDPTKTVNGTSEHKTINNLTNGVIKYKKNFQRRSKEISSSEESESEDSVRKRSRKIKRRRKISNAVKDIKSNNDTEVGEKKHQGNTISKDKEEIINIPDESLSSTINVERMTNKRHNRNSMNFDAQTAAILSLPRRKRVSTDMLYYWSSSSDEDQYAGMIEVKPIRDDVNLAEHPVQHGWIVGDSHKKLVTLLAHTKGKKTEECAVKETNIKKNRYTL